MYLEIKTVLDFKEQQLDNISEPILIKGHCIYMSAIRKWSSYYLNNLFKETPIPIEVYKNRESMGETRVKKYQLKAFNLFIEHILEEKKPIYYLAETPIDTFDKSISKRIYDDIQSNKKWTLKPDEQLIFMGFNSLSGCHLHVNDNYILNQICGLKHVYLFDYRDNPTLKMRSFLSKNNNFIKDNFFSLNHCKLKIYKTTLYPGDSLVIPPWWFHAVEGVGFSCSITNVYERTDLDYLIKFRYLSFLYYLSDYYNILSSFLLIKLLLLLVVLVIIYLKKNRVFRIK